MRPGREVPDEFRSPPEYVKKAHSAQLFDFRIMTALVGGGAETRENDGDDPFRVPSIRGHLRFWWRATIGGQYFDPAKLREAEAAIWGSTETPSRVRIRVVSSDRGAGRDAAGMGPSGRWQKAEPDYALFPLQEDRRNIGKIYTGGRFQLAVEAMPGKTEIDADLNAALWAWVSFGGIGGRTRRGAGALFCAAYPYNVPQEHLRGDGSVKPWPTLKRASLVVGPPYDWQTCWRECIRVLREFRQQRNGTRGRSRWPEPDEIRRITGEHSAQHAPVHPQRGFPRGALGLPIVFHFKTPGDPETTTLNAIDPEGTESRMASPVIIKPWAISATQAAPLMLALNTGLAKRVELRRARSTLKRDIELNGQTIEALLSTAKDQWGGQRFEL